MGVLLLSLSPPAGAMTLPAGFQARTLPLPKASSPTYTNGLQKPTTLDFSPDGKMFVAERNGRILEFDTIEDPTPTLVLSIVDKVMAKGDRGLLGMKLDPEYPSKPFVYLSYTYDAPIGGDSANSTHPHSADGGDDCSLANYSVGCLVSGRLARVELDPATSVAVGGPVDPSSEDVLINSWCQQVTSHSMGDIEFDQEGALLITGGDGASWEESDYGQQGNPCGDPPDEGGSLRSQDVRTPETAADPTNYNGAIIRVDRETGAALPNNPFSLAPVFNQLGGEDQPAKRILAYGMRNPYRFTIQPGTGMVYIGDVGQQLWEEIDRVPSPPGPGQHALNFGWPCFEGGPGGNLPMPVWQSLEKPLCKTLYESPSQVTAPFFAYPHPNTPGFDGHTFGGDACNPNPGSAVAGLVFYEPPASPENAFPDEYDRTLFFADAARGCIWTMAEGADGAPDPGTIANFAVKQEGDASFTPVDVVEGPEGSLFVPNFSGDSIVQIRFQGPSAKIEADKTFGPIGSGFKVKFDASGSTPSAGGGALHYAWDLDGDGQFDDGTDTAKVESTYLSATNVTPRVRVSDGTPHVDVAAITLYPGDLGPPAVEIEAPTPDLTWGLGEQIHYQASATDPDGESLGSGLTPHWEFTIQHCPSACHLHPLSSSDSASGTVTAESDGFPSKFRLEFAATDSRGMSTSQVVELLPRSIEVKVQSDPPGVPLTLSGITSEQPLSVTTIAGESVQAAAPPSAALSGVEYLFAGWSDGGARIHGISSLETKTVVATYKPASELEAPPPPATEPPPTARLGHLRLDSRPAGVPLRVGAVSGKTPFSLRVPLGRRTYLLAPRKVKRHGEVLYFKRWSGTGGAVRTARRYPLTIPAKARFVAVFAKR
ncbi:MAG TPA: PQQ-dependent sugar dehydrogenase [Solirubrobacterales bacterium]|nr:PQQ-dependent sugar dehydrogenase [Solirubrobacterales bacterium]